MLLNSRLQIKTHPAEGVMPQGWSEAGRGTCLVVPVLEATAALLAAEVPHHAVQLPCRPLLTQLRAVIASHTPQS